MLVVVVCEYGLKILLLGKGLGHKGMVCLAAALEHPCGAAGILQHGNIGGDNLNIRLRCIVGEKFLPCCETRVTAHRLLGRAGYQVPYPAAVFRESSLQRGNGVGIGKYRGRRAVTDSRGHLVGRREGVGVHHDYARLERGLSKLNKLAAVGDQRHYPVALFQAKAQHTVRNAAGRSVALSPGLHLAMTVDIGLVRMQLNLAEEHLLHRRLWDGEMVVDLGIGYLSPFFTQAGELLLELLLLYTGHNKLSYFHFLLSDPPERDRRGKGGKRQMLAARV